MGKAAIDELKSTGTGFKIERYTVPGVKEVKVSLEDKKATVTADAKEVPASAIEAAIGNAGQYEGHLIEPPGA